MEIKVKKRNGDLVDFDKVRLYRSIKKAGAEDRVANKVVEKVSSEIKSGDSTESIYKMAFSEISKMEERTAMKYSLRNALLLLGPSGFPFEQFVAEIFRRKGHEVKTNIILNGKCVEHEVDVLAKKQNNNVAIEIKFRNDLKARIDLKVALYIKARFDDLLSKNIFSPKRITGGILISNTKFSTKAIEYAECAKMKMIGWGYPRNGGSIQNLIDEVEIHPITCLPILKKSELKIFFKNNIISCRDLFNTENLSLYGIDKVRAAEIRKQAKILCH